MKSQGEGSMALRRSPLLLERLSVLDESSDSAQAGATAQNIWR